MIIISFKMFMSFFIRFIIFCVKITLSALFVMSLQIQVGSYSLEQHLETFFKTSPIGQAVKELGHGPLPLEDSQNPLLSSGPFKARSYSTFVKRSINQLLEDLEKNYPIQAPVEESPPVSPDLKSLSNIKSLSDLKSLSDIKSLSDLKSLSDKIPDSSASP